MGRVGHVTIGYLDGSALCSILSPGIGGATGARIWKSFDAACSHNFVEIEVPAALGRSMNRVAWVFALNSLAMMTWSDDLRSEASELAWLGAPAIPALHLASARRSGCDHFVTADQTSFDWAELLDLQPILLN